MASPSSNNTNNDIHEENELRLPLTLSQIQQLETEDECAPFFVDLTTLPASQLEHLRETGLLAPDMEHIQLLLSQHRDYLHGIAGERALHASFVSLDSSRPWMMACVRFNSAIAGSQRPRTHRDESARLFYPMHGPIAAITGTARYTTSSIVEYGTRTTKEATSTTTR